MNFERLFSGERVYKVLAVFRSGFFVVRKTAV